MKTTRQKLIDTVGFGFGLWLVGFALGMMFFTIVPVKYMGLVITPLALAAAIWVCVRRFRGKGDSGAYLLSVGAVWLLIAVLFDYLFLAKAFAVENYYDFDVLLYYLITFLLPFAIGRRNAHLPQSTQNVSETEL